MRYFARVVIGLGLLVGALVAVSYSVHQLLQIGTCASGGPYEIARECPSGTEWLGLAIPASLFVMIGAAFVYGTRGTPPGSDRRGDPALGVVVIWIGLFLGIAFACFWGVWGPDANPGPGGKLGGLIVGFLFVPLGLLGAVPMMSAMKVTHAAREATGVRARDAVKLVRGARKRDYGDLVQELRTKASAGGDAGTLVAELERLQKLREQGAIDDAEFQELKRKVVGG